MTTQRIAFAMLVAGTLSGCGFLFSALVKPDTQMRNPIAAGSVETNKIVHANVADERSSEIPEGSASDEATLVSADTKQVCFATTLRQAAHEVDLRKLVASAKAGDKEWVNPRAEIAPPRPLPPNHTWADRPDTIAVFMWGFTG